MNNEWLEKLDIDKNGLNGVVQENIRKYRMGSFIIKLTDGDGNSVKNARVSVGLKKHSFQFGANAFMAGCFESDEKNLMYTEIFRHTFNQATIPFYWKDDEPKEGEYRFSKESPFIIRRQPADYMLDWCDKAGVSPKGHNLVWNSPTAGLPDWLPDNPEKVWNYIVRRMEKISELYRDKVPAWDVVNEFLIRGNDNLPANYPIEAFKEAERLFPNSKLIANEIALWDFQYDASRLYQYISLLDAHKLKVDGVGIQCHLFIPKERLIHQIHSSLNAEYLLKSLSYYSKLGKELHISEITIPSYPTDGCCEEEQAEIAYNLYRLFFSIEGMQSIVWWNLVDGYAFRRPGWDENYYGGGLIRKDFTLKPAYKAINQLINEEWTTKESGAVTENGLFAFCGFYGTYDVNVVTENSNKTYTIDFLHDKFFYELTI